MRGQQSPLWKISKEDLLKLLEQTKGQGFSSIFRALGYTGGGDKYKTLVKRLKHDGINPDEYKGRAKGYSLVAAPKFTDEQVFVENSQYDRAGIKARILKNNYIPYSCADCGCGDTWNGKPITLQLEHKNGINNDHRVENLAFLCPNCHSQTPTWGGRNIAVCKTIYTCATPDCKNEISHGGYLCRPCFHQKDRKVKERPSLKALLADTSILNFEATGRKYGVTGNAIRKWIKAYQKSE